MLDDLGVDDRSAGRHGTHCLDEIVGVGDTILEQVGAAVRTGFEKCQSVRRSGELAEHDDADRGVALPQASGGADSLVSASRWHADVGDDDVRDDVVDQGQKLFVRAGNTCHGEVVLGLEQPNDRFANQIAVVSDDDTGRRDR